MYFIPEMLNNTLLFANQSKFYTTEDPVIIGDASYSVARAIIHISEPPLWKPAYNVSSVMNKDGVLGFTCAMFRPLKN